MPTTMGVYTAGLDAGTEVSSTYEGRHLTVLETELVHPFRASGFVNKGDPVIVALADAADPHGVKGHAVGVALNTATALTDYIAIDTEGIFNLDVCAFDDSGGATGVVNPGDPLYISDDSTQAAAGPGYTGAGDAVLSKIKNRNIQVPFGYALGQIDSAAHGVIAVKVHWDPSVGEEQVGTHAVPYESAVDSKIFREYRYRSSSAVGDIRGQYMELLLEGAGASGEAGRNRTMVEAAVAVAHGCHDGIEFATGGSITGLGVGHRATYKAADKAAGGTIAGGMSELYADGDSTDYGTATEHSIHRFVNDGEATGLATADNVFAFTGLTAVQYAANTDTPAFALRCLINGNIRYIMVSEAQA